MVAVTDQPERGPKVTRSGRPPLQRLIFRRQFYLQLARILMRRRWQGRRDVFVAMMGGIGDLVNAFPSIEQLAERHDLDMGTGGPPYRTMVAANPHVRDVYAPFIYQPARRAHRVLIERALGRVYERVIILNSGDARWWTRGKHLITQYAEACGVPPPSHGRVYLREEHHRAAAAHLDRLGIRDFVYAVQLARGSRPFRSWPLAHYHALWDLLRKRTSLPIVVDTTGSDDTALPDFCLPLGRLGIMPACAMIERARLFVGPDSGLTHVAGALGTPTVAIHLGFPAESCAALGEKVAIVAQREPFDDPALTTPAEVIAAIERWL
jgi:ADP-heptose:LPS heptosyltransferase